MATTRERLLDIEDLRASFVTYEGEVHALNGVDLTIDRGEVVGLVGESGAGKSVVAWSIMQLVPEPGRASGSIRYRGQDLLNLTADQLRDVRGRDLALIVPNARNQLNPLLTVGVQLANAMKAHRPDVSHREAMSRAVGMMAAVGIPDPARRASALPGELSGGMAQRIVIGMALMHSPTLLIADEATSGLDVTIQAQVLETFKQLIAEREAAALLITRDLGIVAHYCDRAAIMYGGEVVEEADVGTLFSSPSHPYTRALLSAVRYYDLERIELDGAGVGGSSLNLLDLPQGCFFFDRCPQRMDVCRREHPLPRRVGGDSTHNVRCHLYAEQEHA
jgi:oligopeptide/dipeptide ABC transporter ATP-binding protein